MSNALRARVYNTPNSAYRLEKNEKTKPIHDYTKEEIFIWTQ